MTEERSILLDLGSGGLNNQVEEVTGSLGGLEKVLSRLKTTVAEAFAAWQVLDFMKKAATSAEGLSKDLLVLRLRLGSLRAALGEALTPLGQIFIPMLNAAILAVTRFVKTVGEISSALLGMEAGNRVVEATTAAVTAAGKAAKCSLASFDQLERLNGAAGSGSSAAAGENTLSVPALDWDRVLLLDKLKKMLNALKDIDLTNVEIGLRRLQKALEPLGKHLFDGLQWGWYNILVPLAKWTVEEALPRFLELLRAGLELLGNVITAVKPALSWLWENLLEPAAGFVGDAILWVLEGLAEKLRAIGAWVSEHQGAVEELAKVAGVIALTMAGVNVALELFGSHAGSGTLAANLFGSGLSGLVKPGNLISAVILGIVAAVQSCKLAFSGLMPLAEAALETINRSFTNLKAFWQNAVNGIIGFINKLLSAVGQGLNAAILAINRLSVTMPSWIPGLGGKHFGFSLQTVTLPQIPYLAQGAVLPANKPFMAVVGDQRHGTNVEAPLATIQEAVAAVMQGQTDALLAGFEASVGVQREILEAVLGISIGDDVLGSAVARYNRRQAIMKGELL